MRQSYIPTVAELQAFLACAKLGTTTGAAQSLNLTQSAVSRSIQSAEARLGVQLFLRVRKRLLLSDAGRVFLREAERLLDGLDAAALNVMAFGGHRDVLRLAVLPTFGATWLIPRLTALQQVAPRVTFDISARLMQVDFDAEPFDAAIHRGVHPHPGVRTEHLADEVLVAVAAPELLARREAGDAGDAGLASLPLLQQSTRPTLWLDWFRDAGLDHRRISRGARFEHFGMIIEAAIAGLGVALVPQVLVAERLRGGVLALASARRVRSAQPYTLCYPDRSEDSDGFRAFRGWILEQAAG